MAQHDTVCKMGLLEGCEHSSRRLLAHLVGGQRSRQRRVGAQRIQKLHARRLQQKISHTHLNKQQHLRCN